DADKQSRGPAELRFEDEQVAGWQQRGIADVEVGRTLDRERAGARAADQESEQVAVLVKAALGNRDQGTAERQVARHEDQRLESLLVCQRPPPRPPTHPLAPAHPPAPP